MRSAEQGPWRRPLSSHRAQQQLQKAEEAPLEGNVFLCGNDDEGGTRDTTTQCGHVVQLFFEPHGDGGGIGGNTTT